MTKIASGLLGDLLADIGGRLSAPTTICVVGGTASILLGQPERQTRAIDIWGPESDFDTIALKGACERAAIHLQILRPGITMFPERFAVEKLGRFGNLTLVMPPPGLIVATKLARGWESDLEDAAWWIRERRLSDADIESGIAAIPQPENQDAARENLFLVQLVAGRRKS
ncbi:MAG: hypothetical protein HQL40_09085 [Alphaproteobacteria bacterium]|nr:hypothetical protein [Alphaproteobacteria bacterium]